MTSALLLAFLRHDSLFPLGFTFLHLSLPSDTKEFVFQSRVNGSSRANQVISLLACGTNSVFVHANRFNWTNVFAQAALNCVSLLRDLVIDARESFYFFVGYHCQRFRFLHRWRKRSSLQTRSVSHVDDRSFLSLARWFSLIYATRAGNTRLQWIQNHFVFIVGRDNVEMWNDECRATTFPNIQTTRTRNESCDRNGSCSLQKLERYLLEISIYKYS